jgi:ribosomal protein S18 acetylase RimI-like enzyme
MEKPNVTLTTLPLKKIRRHTLRPFTEADYPAVASLFIQHDMEFIGDTNFSEEMLRASWASQPNFDPTKSVAIAQADDGTVVGAAIIYMNQPIPVRPNLFAMALPDWAETVITSLLEWAIEEAKTVFERVPAHARVVFQAANHSKNTRTADRFKARGLTTNRAFYTMLIRFEGQSLPTPVLPEGIKLVTFAEHPSIEDFARAVRDGFADHRGASADTPWSYHLERMQKMTEEPHFDPTLFWLAQDAETGELAGVCNSFSQSEEFRETGYIQQLAVLPNFRRRGLALALLHVAFNEHFKRGLKGVSLGVDAASLTNAVALYERAGMSIAAQYDAYELELRPGEELTKQ